MKFWMHRSQELNTHTRCCLPSQSSLKRTFSSHVAFSAVCSDPHLHCHGHSAISESHRGCFLEAMGSLVALFSHRQSPLLLHESCCKLQRGDRGFNLRAGFQKILPWAPQELDLELGEKKNLCFVWSFLAKKKN